ncbi:MAG: ribose-5-phosphate isomerase RpiA [Legionellaceae bacterium]|nr:ribose-5-phosphate isomerase RpiA [Legionellaceae bacterium]
MDALKAHVAQAALAYVKGHKVLGIGSGLTVQHFIEALASHKYDLDACVASSEATAAQLKACGIPVIDCNEVSEIPLYIDSADEIDADGRMIKGGGGAHTREKILASLSRSFLCLVEQRKVVARLGQFPLPIEVLPMARSSVARAMVVLGGAPEYRRGFVTDNGNIILDVYHLNFNTPIALEEQLKNIPGVVDSGLFAKRRADTVLIAEKV